MAAIMRELLSRARVASPDEAKRYFKPGDRRWSETLQGEDSPDGKPLILINDAKFLESGAAPDYRNKAAMGEAMHLFKNRYPKRYNKLLSESMREPEFRDWMMRSYEYEKKEHGEDRPFNAYLRQSRFDQILGGYVFAGDPAFPTLRKWDRETLPFSDAIKRFFE